MFQDVEKYVRFLADNRLSQPQFLMMYCLYRKKYEAIAIYKEAFPTPDGGMIGSIEKEDLLNRGFIEMVGTDNKASSYKLTDKFTKIYLKDAYAAADEVWGAYPGFVNIDGKNIPLTNMDRYKFANLYAERIKYSVEEHLEVMKDVDFGKRKGLLRTTIEKFAQSENWSKIRQVRLAQEVVQEFRKEEETNF